MKFVQHTMAGAISAALIVGAPAVAQDQAVEAEATVPTPAPEAAPAAAPVAAPPSAPAVTTAPAAPAAPAAHTPEGSELFVPAPPEGKGQVVFFRNSFMGMAMGCTVNQGTKKDKTKITSLGNGKYSIIVAEPGKQDYWVKNEKKDGLTLLVEEGETQYVRCKIKMGLMSGRPDISPSSPEEFAEKSGSLKLVDDDDMGEGALRSDQIAALQ